MEFFEKHILFQCKKSCKKYPSFVEKQKVDQVSQCNPAYIAKTELSSFNFN